MSGFSKVFLSSPWSWYWSESATTWLSPQSYALKTVWNQFQTSWKHVNILSTTPESPSVYEVACKMPQVWLETILLRLSIDMTIRYDLLASLQVFSFSGYVAQFSLSSLMICYDSSFPSWSTSLGCFLSSLSNSFTKCVIHHWPQYSRYGLTKENVRWAYRLPPSRCYVSSNSLKLE